MNLLLDTHVWVWSQEEPERIGTRAAAAVTSMANRNHVATVSTLEIARLATARQITFQIPMSRWIEQSIAELAADTLLLTHEIAAEAYALPDPFHRDPADRILVATARHHRLVLVTADERILRYAHVKSLDARR